MSDRFPGRFSERFSERFSGKLALQQRVLPAYRAPFFELLACACQGGLSLFAGQPRPVEAIATVGELQHARYTPARNRHLFHPRHPLYMCWQPDIVRWLEDCRPDALIVEANPRYPTTRRALAWMHTRGKRVLGWGLGAPALGGPLASWRGRARLRLLRALDGVIAYSERGAAEYRALGLPPDRVFVAHNAAAPRPLSPPPPHPSTAAQDAALPHSPAGVKPAPTPLTTLFVGRLQARKRVDNLLHACAALPEALRPRLVIVGDGPAKADLQALAQTVYPQAAFPGAQHGDALTPYFAAADLFALPGTGGLAVQQAMAHGLPVVVAQGDGTQDDLVRPANGWQVPPGDLPALTETLAKALRSPARLRQMGAESFRIVFEEINLEAMVASFVRAIQKVQI